MLNEESGRDPPIYVVLVLLPSTTKYILPKKKNSSSEYPNIKEYGKSDQDSRYRSYAKSYTAEQMCS